MTEVTITLKEYESLQRDSDLLRALQDAGVDNWQGYSYALNFLSDEEGEDE